MATLLKRRGGGGNVVMGTNTEGSAWIQAVAANGGTVGAGRALVVERFIAAEKVAGTWDLTDDYWGLWAENAPQALTSLKQRRLATVVAAPTFVVDRGYTFDGVANYVSTLFVPGTHGVALTGTNGRLAVYERTDVLTNTTSIGGNTNGNLNFQLIARGPTNVFFRYDMTVGIGFTAVTDGRGYTVGSRNGNDSTTVKCFKNGVERAFLSGVPTFLTTLPTTSLHIGALNNAGTANGFRAVSIGFACVGAALSAEQELAQYNNVQAWATAVGANV